LNQEVIHNIWDKHRGKIIGVILGLVISLLIIIVGFFKGVFIILCCMAGYYIGRRIDNKENLREILEHILPPGYRS
jgi:uncharacterized membrane protein